jgi:lysine/ornithine N-monooxygenase
MEQVSSQKEQELLDIYVSRKIGVIGTGQMGSDIFMAFENYISDIQKKYNKHTSVNSKELFYLADADKSKKAHFNNLGYKNFVTNEEVIH